MGDANIPSGRRGVCRLADISESVRQLLSAGGTETANWTEWMATDMPTLARAVAHATVHRRLKSVLLTAADEVVGERILTRLGILGRMISSAVGSFEDPAFKEIATHRSDVVRQWGAYAVNDKDRTLTLAQRLSLTLPFAADHHMSVRECAWMAFRPHLIARLEEGLLLLESVTRAEDANLRRFAIEVTRPRSVWGSHITALKRTPGNAVALLDNVHQDSSRYVRLAAGNWLNDASKSRPDWVRELCSRWSKSESKHTKAIIRRGLRTIARLERSTMKNTFVDLDEYVSAGR